MVCGCTCLIRMSSSQQVKSFKQQVSSWSYSFLEFLFNLGQYTVFELAVLNPRNSSRLYRRPHSFTSLNQSWRPQTWYRRSSIPSLREGSMIRSCDRLGFEICGICHNEITGPLWDRCKLSQSIGSAINRVNVTHWRTTAAPGSVKGSYMSRDLPGEIVSRLG